MDVSAALKTVLPLILVALLGCREAQFKVKFVEKAVSDSSGAGGGGGGGGGGSDSGDDSQPGGGLVPLPDPNPVTDSCIAGKTQSESIFFAASSGMGSSYAQNIIFVLDTSGSMYSEMKYLEKSLPQFLTTLQSKLPAELSRVVLFSNAPFTIPSGVYHHYFSVGSTNKISSIKESLSVGNKKQIPDSVLIQTPGAVNHYVIITDDIEGGGRLGMACSYSTASSVKEYTDCQTGEFQKGVVDVLAQQSISARLHAIHWNKTPSDPAIALTCGAGSSYAKILGASPYTELTEAFGGGSYDLCAPDWDMLLKSLAESIAQSAKPGALTGCEKSRLKVTSAQVVQNGVSKEALSGVVLTQASGTQGALVSLKPGYLESLGLNSSQAYRVVVTTKVY